MSVYQQVFSIFYAILFGAMLASLETMRPYPWGYPAENDPRIKAMLQRRLLCGISLFNILPIGVYISGLWLLPGKENVAVYIFGLSLLPGKENVDTTQIDYLYMFFVALSALSVFAPYRVYHLLFILLFRHGKCSLYTACQYYNIIKKRSIRETPLGNILAFIFYFLLLFLPLLYRNIAATLGCPLIAWLVAMAALACEFVVLRNYQDIYAALKLRYIGCRETMRGLSHDRIDRPSISTRYHRHFRRCLTIRTSIAQRCRRL